MKRLFLCMIALSLFVACDKDDDHSYPVDNHFQTALLDKYPGATQVEWKQIQGYYVADFYWMNGSTRTECEAWFAADGSWYMTESDLLFAELPQAVIDAFNGSEYAAWRVDDVDMLERSGEQTLYVIEVEGHLNGVETDVHLFYAADGTLVESVTGRPSSGGYADYLPNGNLSQIQAFVAQNYPDARIVDIEHTHNGYEVDILDGLQERDLYFDASAAWLMTKTEIFVADLPEAVVATIAGQFTSYLIDDADWVQTPQVEYYLVEIENRGVDTYLKITATGEIVP